MTRISPALIHSNQPPLSIQPGPQQLRWHPLCRQFQLLQVSFKINSRAQQDPGHYLMPSVRSRQAKICSDSSGSAEISRGNSALRISTPGNLGQAACCLNNNTPAFCGWQFALARVQRIGKGLQEERNTSFLAGFSHTLDKMFNLSGCGRVRVIINQQLYPACSQLVDFFGESSPSTIR